MTDVTGKGRMGVGAGGKGEDEEGEGNQKERRAAAALDFAFAAGSPSPRFFSQLIACAPTTRVLYRILDSDNPSILGATQRTQRT